MYMFIRLGRLGYKLIIQLGVTGVPKECLVLHKDYMCCSCYAHHDILAQGPGMPELSN